MGKKLVIDEMWNCKQRGLKGNEASVLAVIVRCSRGDSPKGWYSSFQALADCIPFSISDETVRNAVNKLVKLGMVEYRDNAYFAPQFVVDTPQFVVTTPQNVANSPQILPKSAPLNNPPINNINKNGKENKMNPTPSFMEFMDLFRLNINSRVSNEQTSAAYDLWQHASLKRQRKAIEMVSNPTGGEKNRPDWFLEHVSEPQPEFLSGAQQDENWKRPHPERLFIVRYDGKALCCTEQTMNEFHLDPIREVLPHKD